MTLARALTSVILASTAGAALAAPVGSGSEPSDPYELAVQWTLASVSPRELPARPPEPPALPALRIGGLPHAGAIEGGVPEPAAYAALGLLLLGAGLVARHIAAPRGRPGRR
ncbi:MAG: hypothetical protein Fur0014_03680 [Rubrivivax sp.]